VIGANQTFNLTTRAPSPAYYSTHNVYYVKPDAMLKMFMRLIRY